MSKKRSIIIDKRATSISLEEAFWEELDRFASSRGKSWQDFLRELLEIDPHPPNRAAAVKEALIRLMRMDKDADSSPRLESWWSVKWPKGKKNICTNGVRLLVGRDVANDIIIKDDEVSRRHLMLSYDGKSWWVIDLDSKNGTKVDGSKISCCCRLTSGMAVNIGLSEIRLL